MRLHPHPSPISRRGSVVLETLVATSILASLWIGLHLIVRAGLERIALRTAAEAVLRDARAGKAPLTTAALAAGVAARIECDRAELVLALDDGGSSIELVVWRRAPLLAMLLGPNHAGSAPAGGPWIRTEVAMARPWAVPQDGGR